MRRDEVSRTPSAVFARRVREAREDRGWSQQRLADEHGVDRTTIVKLEAGETGQSRTRISIDDVYNYALTLGLHPIDLLAPLEDGEAVEVGGKIRSARVVRDWIEGRGTLRGSKPAPRRFIFRQMPRTRLRALVDAALMPPPEKLLAWAAGGGGEKHAQLVDEVVELLRNLPIEEGEDA